MSANNPINKNNPTSEKQLEKAPPSEAQLEKMESLYRGMIVHENELQNHRLTWFLVIQGFLLTALASSWESKFLELSIVLCLLGILISLSFCEGLGVSTRTQDKLKETWKTLWKELLEQYGIERIEGLGNTLDENPKQKNSTDQFRRLIRPWRSLPYIFVATWVVILIISCTR